MRYFSKGLGALVGFVGLVGFGGGDVLSNEAKVKTPAAFVVPQTTWSLAKSSAIALLLFWLSARLLRGRGTKLSHHAQAVH